MKISRKSSYCLIPLLLCFSLPALAVSYIAIDKTPTADGASISSSLTSQTRIAQKNAFLSDEPINLSFHLTIAAEDIGTPSELFLLASYNGFAFMRNQAGQWLPWDGQASTLQATSSKKLQAQENITVLNKIPLPAGEYILFTAYRTGNGDIKYNREPVTFMVSDIAKAALHRVQSAAFLNEFFSNAQSNSGYHSQTVSLTDANISGGSLPTATASTNISQSNLQEAGVVESDVIKIRGNILFALEQCSTNIDPVLIFLGQYKSCLTSYRLQETPASATQLDREEFNKTGHRQDALFLNDDTNSTPSNRLVWVSSNIKYGVTIISGEPYTGGVTDLMFFDITDPENLTSVKTLSLDVGLISSRRLGDQLYLITRKRHNTVVPPAEATQNDSGLPLPTISIDDGEKQSLVAATDCYVPASQSDQPYDGTIVTITSVSIKNPENFHSTCIAGNIETAYVSTEALYLATSRYPYSTLDNVISYDQAPEYSTEIHKFAFTDDHVRYKGSGTVPGHLGWEMDKKQFRMGEHKGILKVATSLGESWGPNSTTRVGVLQENSDGSTLEEISFLDNLGKPGEKLFAARFISNRGYLVTFRVTDPLYMLDFTEPETPKMLGELAINGYFDYLHPIGESYLLGIGKDAIPDTSATDFADRGAVWYQGVKLSLFDVSDGANLREIQSVVIGQRGSSSAVFGDRRALAWLATNEPDHFRLAISISEHTSKKDWIDYSQPSAFYNWTKTGAYVFDIRTDNTPDLSLSGRLITEVADDYAQTYEVLSSNDRIVLQGSALHFIHDNSVFSSPVNDLN